MYDDFRRMGPHENFRARRVRSPLSLQIVYFAHFLEIRRRGNVVTLQLFARRQTEQYRTDDERIGTPAEIEFSLIKCSLGRDLTVD